MIPTVEQIQAAMDTVNRAYPPYHCTVDIECKRFENDKPMSTVMWIYHPTIERVFGTSLDDAVKKVIAMRPTVEQDILFRIKSHEDAISAEKALLKAIKPTLVTT